MNWDNQSKAFLYFLIFGFIIASTLLHFGVKLFFAPYKLIEETKSYSIKVEDVITYKGNSYVNDSISIGVAYNPSTLNTLSSMIQVGDSIEIKANSDTILLFQNGETYWFDYQMYKMKN